MPVVGRIQKQLAATLHAVCGWVWFRAGCRVRARRHYERVLELRGDDFGAYVHLGRIAFALGDYAGWRREFEHARRTDPNRFARLRHPFEPYEPRLAGTDLDSQGPAGDPFGLGSDRATWRSLWFGTGPRRLTSRRNDGDDPAGSDRAELPAHEVLPTALPTPEPSEGPGRQPNPPPSDDCASPRERERFRALGPIRATDIGRCDFDDLARRLGG